MRNTLYIRVENELYLTLFQLITVENIYNAQQLT